MRLISKIKYFLTLSFLLLGVSISSLLAQEISVPIDVQIDILPKILSLNKSFDLGNPNTTIKVGILYSSILRNSEKVKNGINDQTAKSNSKIRKANVVFIPIDVSKIKVIKSYLTQNNINVLYFAPLRGYDITSISKICKEEQIITFTGVSSFMDESDISVGFELQDNKLEITINLESAKAEGANFSSRLLSLSKVK
ncbi:MAG: YfiR family protein [Ignavibacteriae bacterium]|nr:YfiR family protein [Ignavibacteriota bacterium]